MDPQKSVAWPWAVLAQVAGVALVVAGVAVVFAIGWAILAGGALLLVGGTLSESAQVRADVAAWKRAQARARRAA